MVTCTYEREPGHDHECLGTTGDVHHVYADHHPHRRLHPNLKLLGKGLSAEVGKMDSSEITAAADIDMRACLCDVIVKTGALRGRDGMMLGECAVWTSAAPTQSQHSRAQLQTPPTFDVAHEEVHVFGRAALDGLRLRG